MTKILTGTDNETIRLRKNFTLPRTCNHISYTTQIYYDYLCELDRLSRNLFYELQHPRVGIMVPEVLISTVSFYIRSNKHQKGSQLLERHLYIASRGFVLISTNMDNYAYEHQS